uniref:Uncharacterized protein n=1 Tax=Aegilops tauschii TaxID=37682 RepID=R7W3D0_AEGTA
MAARSRDPWEFVFLVPVVRRIWAAAAASVAHEVCALPFPPDRASHHRELAAAVASVERACRLCVDVY